MPPATPAVRGLAQTPSFGARCSRGFASLAWALSGGFAGSRGDPDLYWFSQTRVACMTLLCLKLLLAKTVGGTFPNEECRRCRL